MTIYSRVIAYYAADILRDLVTLAFDWPFYDISHRQSLTMRSQPIRRGHITWPLPKGAKFANIFEMPDLIFMYSFVATYVALRWRYIRQNSLRPCATI